MTTIREIAQKAGVSAGTVSRILNEDNTLSVAVTTRQRVVQIADELAYNAEKLQTNRKWTKSIAVVTTLSAEQEQVDEYYRKIWRGIYEASEKKGVKVSHIFRLQNLSEPLDVSKFAAVIFVGAIEKYAIHELYLKNPNLVLIDDRLVHVDGVDAVTTDLKEKVFELLNAFWTSGYRDIAFVGGKRESMDLSGHYVSVDDDTRYAAYKSWMQSKHLVPRAVLAGWQTADAVTATNELLNSKEKIDAILVASDPLAVGVLKVLSENEHHIAVASFNDVEIGKYLTPSLTTVHIPAEEIGQTALVQAVERSTNTRNWPTWLVIPSYIVYRETFVK